MRIEVDDQHVLADSGERGAEIYGGRGFPDAAFLIGHRQDAGVPYRLGPNFAAGQLLASCDGGITASGPPMEE